MVQLVSTQRIESVTPETFTREFKASRRPVVLETLTRAWPAYEMWGLDYFAAALGDKIVPLYDSKPARDRKHQHAPAKRIPLADYLDLLRGGEKDLRMFSFNIHAEAPALKDDFRHPEIGLKFVKNLPVLFMGGAGARVQMHFDIDLSDLLLCHFGGRKRVLLFSPEQTRYLYRVPFSFSSLFDVEIDEPDYDKYPALRHVEGEVAELDHGDALYIPPGYWHFVLYDQVGFSLTLRAFPRQPAIFLRMLYNILILRSAESLMRRTVGQRWNDRNERRAIEKTHKHLSRRTRAA